MNRIVSGCVVLVSIGVLVAAAAGEQASASTVESLMRVPPTQLVRSMLFAHDGKTIATLRYKANIANERHKPPQLQLWAVPEGTLLWTAKVPVTRLLDFSPDDTRLAGVTSDGTVVFWDTRAGKLLFRLAEVPRTWPVTAAYSLSEEPKWSVGPGVFMPDGRVFVAVVNQWPGAIGWPAIAGKIAFWDATTGHFMRTLTTQTHGITALAISQDGKTLAVTCQAPHVGGPGRIVKLWDVATDRIRHVLHPGTNVIEMISLAFAPDGAVLATGEEDSAGKGEIGLWDTGTGHLKRIIADPDSRVVVPISPRPLLTFSPDGKSLASVTMNQSVILWDPTTGKRQTSLQAETPPQPGRYAIRFTRQGMLLAHENRLNQVQVDSWNDHQ